MKLNSFNLNWITIIIIWWLNYNNEWFDKIEISLIFHWLIEHLVSRYNGKWIITGFDFSSRMVDMLSFVTAIVVKASCILRTVNRHLYIWPEVVLSINCRRCFTFALALDLIRLWVVDPLHRLLLFQFVDIHPGGFGLFHFAKN